MKLGAKADNRYNETQRDTVANQPDSVPLKEETDCNILHPPYLILTQPPSLATPNSLRACLRIKLASVFNIYICKTKWHP